MIRNVLRHRQYFGSTAIALVLGTSAALAQTAVPPSSAPSPADQAAAQPVEQVVVTGSLLNNPNFTAPTPVTAVTSQSIDTRAVESIGQDISELPFVQAGGGLQNNVGGIIGQAESFTNLRGLGDNRTLTLLDGQRPTPENSSNNFDTSLVPSNLIQRFDVVTTGASASYGSDAVAGVVNLILKDHFEGFSADVQYGISQRADYDKPYGSIAYGTDLFGDKLHIVIGGEIAGLFGASTSLAALNRNWESQEPGLVTLPTTRAAGQPANVFSNNVEYDSYTQGGLITSGALKGIAFSANGTPYNFQYGSVVGSTDMIGTGNYGQSTGNHQLEVPFFRLASLGRAEYNIDSDTTAFLTLNYGELDQSARSTGSPIPETFVISSGNPYIPASIQSDMTADHLSTITVNKQTLQGVFNYSDDANILMQSLFGVSGKVFGDWSWNFKGNTGESIKEETFGGVPDVANVYQAANAVTGPNGVPVCGSAATNATINSLTGTLKSQDLGIISPGCVPYNVFGTAPLSSAQYNYMFNPTDANGNYVGRDELYAHIYQTMFSADLSGSPISLPAGAVDLAVGADWRTNSYNQTNDEGDQGSWYNSGNFGSYKISESVWEVYSEAGVPLLKNLPFAESVDLSGAVRYTDYSISGGVTTWKYGATWDVNDEFRLRATMSQDIRAPNFSDLSPVVAPGRGTFTNPLSGVSATINDNDTIGSSTLKPENAKNLSAGMVFNSDYDWLPGFRASVDYYRVNITGVITTLAVQDVVNRCLLQNLQNFCNQIQFSGTSLNSTFGIIGDIIPPQNLNSELQDGVDFNVSEHLPLDDYGLPGTLDWSTLASYVNQQRIIEESEGVIISDVNYADTASAPRWSANSTLTYSLDRVVASLQLLYYSPLEYSAIDQGPGQAGYNPASPTSVNRNIWPAVTQFNLHLAYDVFPKEDNNALQVYLNVDNLFDKDPPEVWSSISNYDPIGRYFRLGLRYNTN
jgi:iron complex outermembrane recepter protein